MSGGAHPWHLAVQIPESENTAAYLQVLATVASAHDGNVLAAQPSAAVETLEQGSPAISLALLEFPRRESATAFWKSEDHQRALTAMAADPEPLVILAPGLPYEGLPEAMEIPTAASVTPPASDAPNAYMLIQGTTYDQGRMDQYRDIILPMIAALGAYYIAFDISGEAQALSGERVHDIFAISLWPDHAAGHAFWDSDRYQNVAIPTRAGAGDFIVHFVEAA